MLSRNKNAYKVKTRPSWGDSFLRCNKKVKADKKDNRGLLIYNKTKKVKEIRSGKGKSNKGGKR